MDFGPVPYDLLLHSSVRGYAVSDATFCLNGHGQFPLIPMTFSPNDGHKSIYQHQGCDIDIADLCSLVFYDMKQ